MAKSYWADLPKIVSDIELAQKKNFFVSRSERPTIQPRLAGYITKNNKGCCTEKCHQDMVVVVEKE